MDKINIDNHTLDYGATKNVSIPNDEGYIFKSFIKDCIHKPYPFEITK